MKKLITTIACSVALTAGAWAQECTTVEYAESLMDEGMDRECYECLTKLLNQDDQNGEVYFAFGQLYHKVGDYAYALEMYDKAEFYMAYAGNKTLLADVYLFHAICFDNLGMYDQECEYLHKAIQTDGKNFWGHYYLAKCYINRKEDLREAEKHADKSLRLAANEKERATVYNLKSSIALKSKRYVEATSYAEKCISENPESENGYARLAEAYKETGDLSQAADNAIACIERYTEYNSDIKMSENILIEYAIEDYESAIAKVQEKTVPSKGWTYMKVTMAEKAKRYEDALNILDNEAETDDGSDYYEKRYRIEEKLGDFVSAAQHSGQAYILDPSDPTHICGQVLHLESAGDEEAYLKTIDQAIEDWPAMSFLYYRKGFHQYNRKQYAEAISNLKTAYDLDNENIWAVLPLAQSYLKTGDKKEADKWFRRIIESDPKDTGHDECIAFAYYYLGDNDKAIASVGDDEYSNACLYSLIGDKKEALDHLKKALEDGFVNFQHIAHDAALDNIKHEEKFMSLIDEYKTRLENRLSSRK